MTFEPTEESVRRHVVPDWFHDAKLGFFVHWGLYSVPAWAPPTGDLPAVVAAEGWEGWFTKNPYAEWYANSIKLPASPSRKHHDETYGEDFAYEDFAPRFNQAVADWNPAEWAALFRRAGARYAVLVTKHHDGFLLWPSERPNPRRPGFHAERDLVGALTDAVRAEGLAMGLYYSGGLDWTFDPTPIRDITTLFTSVVQTPEFVEYANGHWRELIERYRPAMMWNDIGYPAAADLPELFAFYYNSVPEGVINDRFGQGMPEGAGGGEGGLPRPRQHFDYRTPEYASFDTIRPEKWESTRGIGHSFGYNQLEGPENYLQADALIRMLVDIVSKNGNLLLNVGPMADGTISEPQRRCLLSLGAWLDRNGAAIYGTRPWNMAEGRTEDGIDVRYTQTAGALYATLLDTPRGAEVRIPGLRPDPAAAVRLLGHAAPLAWRQDGDGLAITLPDGLAPAPAHAFEVAPKPAP